MAVPKKMEEYCEEFTQKLIGSSFPGRGKITGQEILTYSPIKQLNLFILKNLLIEWQREIARLKSPYFNFDSEDVKESIENFANVLSQNILISRDDFEPLVYRSALETITLLTTPYEFYIALAIEANEKQYTLKELESIEKYIKHNQFVYSHFIKELKSENYALENYKAVVEGIFKHTELTPEDPEPHIREFSKIHPFSPDLLQEEESEKITPAVETVAKEEVVSRITLHETLIDTESRSLADIHQHKKIQDIRRSLNLNQKFMFINGLFDGDEDRFNTTIDDIEKLQSYDEAITLIENRFSWDKELEEVEEFFELVSKRLSKD